MCSDGSAVRSELFCWARVATSSDVLKKYQDETSRG